MKQNWKQLLRRTESAILALLMLLSMVEITPAARAASDTVESPVIVKQADGKYTVTLNFKYEGTADSVSIKGGIPGIDWGENQAAMNNTDGVWSYTFTDLTSGIYPYKFYTSNDEWIADPQNTLRDGDDNGLLVLDETPVIAYHDEDNTYRVTLRYADTAGTATSVDVRGDGKLPGTTWGDDSISMSKTAADSNIWLATFENVQPGSCAYKFVINGTDWMADPNVLETDSDGNSLLTLGKPEFTSPEVNGRAVTFRYYAPNAGNVYLVGEMNGWNTSADPLKKDSSGVWSLTKALSMGVYGYKFFVDGDWKADPVNPDHIDNDHAPVDDPEGNSKLVVSGLSEDSLTAQKGGSITLPETLTLIDKDGKSSSVAPNYTLSSNPAGITLDGKTLYVSDSYIGDHFVVNAEYEGYISQIVIYVLASPTDSVMMLFHYNRPDNNYEDWDLWFWPDGGDGRAYSFDSNGTAIVAVPEDSTRFGYIIRYGGDSWAGKDIDSNQFIDIPEMVSGIVHIYAKSGVPGYSKGYDASAEYEHKPIRASLNEQNNVTAILTGKLADEDLADFKILDSDGRTIQVVNAEGHEASNSTWVYVLMPAENLTPGKVYRLQYKEAVYEIAMLNVYSSEAFENAYTYEGNDLGAVWTAQKTTFRVWAPTATAVTVNLYRSGTEGADDLMERLPMTADVCGTWVAEKAGDLNGTYYTYTAKFSGQENETVDPYARAAGVNGKRSMVIDLASTNPAGWEADKNPNASLTYNDAIIYELHVRDLSADGSSGITNAGKFLGLTESGTKTPGGTPTGLDHIKALGITHLHLLPVFDYSSSSVAETNPAAKYNWGYDPVNYNVPEGSYSTDPYHGEVRINEMKQMVKSLHDNGISVVMDVVYNHVHDADTFSVNMLVPGYFSRTYEDGTYSDDSICGNDTASERSMVRKFIVDSVKYWADEYHIDGFRFDLVGLLDTQTINQIVTEVHKTHPDAIFYGEGWDMVTPAAVSKEGVLFATQKNSPQTPNFAYFSDTIRDALKGSAFNDSTGYVSGASGKEKLIQQTFMGLTDWCATPAQTINYASCHDNNTLMDRITLSTPDASREDRIRMNNLAAAVYLTAEGIPLVHAGEEMLRTKPDGNGGFVKDSYESPDSVNSLKWGELDNEEYRAVYEYYKGLIAFRKAHAALRLTNAGDVRNHVKPVDGLPENVVAFQINGGVNGEISDGLYVIFNPNNAVQNIPLPAGVWDVFINGDKAGTEVLETVEGTAVVAPVSALVLVKQSTDSKPTTPDIPSIPDTPSTPDIPSTPGTTNTPSTSTTAPTIMPDVTTDSHTKTTTATPSSAIENGVAQVTIPSSMGTEIVNQAIRAGSSTIIIAPEITQSVNRVEVTIPASIAGDIAEKTSASLRVETPTIDVTISNKALSGMSGDVTVSTSCTGSTFEVSVKADGRDMSHTSGGITAEIFAKCGPGTVAMLVDEAGNHLAAVRKSMANSSGSTMIVPLDGSARIVLVDNNRNFTDVPASNWAYEAIAFASSHELMNGTAGSSFSPDDPMTRGMLAMVLHNLENNPRGAYSSGFTDVDRDAWYSEAVHWVADQGIVNGVSPGMFAPDSFITREQLVVMLYRYSSQAAVSKNEIGRFHDSDRISSWAVDAMNWAVSNNILTGFNGGLNPIDSATRAEVAAILKRFCASIAE